MSQASLTVGVPRTHVLAPESSRRHCERCTREAAKNFYYGLRLLAEPKRSSMFALYTFMRVIDDVVDEDVGGTTADRHAELERWRARTHEAISTRRPPDDHPMWPAFIDMVSRHDVPAAIFDDAISGQARDLSTEPFADFAALEYYCYQVAGTVGLASVYVFGFDGGDETEILAVKRGLAFQLTNILRDVREDASKGRVYLPHDEMTAAGLTRTDLVSASCSPRLNQFLLNQAHRAERAYLESIELDERIHAASRPTLRAMTEIYRGILDQIIAEPARVLRERVSLSLMSKLRIAWRAARSRP